MSRQDIKNRSFVIVLGAITLAFLTILQPFWSSIFWACVMTLLFFPLQRRLRSRLNGKDSLAALLTLTAGIFLVVIPVTVIGFAFFAEGAQLYELIENQEINPEQLFERIGSAVPVIPDILQRIGIDMSSLRTYLSDSAIGLSRLLSQEALSFGRNTLSFTVGLALMLYLTFFLLRDGDKMMSWLNTAVPLENDRQQLLFRKFTEVVRATVKGNLLVAMIQGALGGLIFWILGITAPVLWAVVMAFLSLVPAVGAALVWVPVAIYLFATGDLLQGSILVAYGAIIIGLADNVLRPILVGRDTKLPDYIVLFSTLGGLSLLGINGFVIGPLIAALFISFWAIFSQDFNR